MMNRRAQCNIVRAPQNRKGYALMVVLLITLVAGAVALHAAMLGMNTTLMQGSSDRAAVLDDAAIAGIEEVRNRLNARLDSVPVTGYGLIEDGVAVASAPGARRWTYVGRRGNTDGQTSTGEYGVVGHIISRVADPLGNTSIRRAEIYQESFARFADFTDRTRRADGAALYWALGMEAAGPVHSNDTIRIWTDTPWPQATFHSDVTTSEVVQGTVAGLFLKAPPKEGVSPIALPSTADMNSLKTTATAAGYSFTPAIVVGDTTNTTLRIQFIAIDTDGDGNNTGPTDGFFRVYRLNNVSRGEGYARASVPDPDPSAPVPGGATAPIDSVLFSWNCGRTVAGFVAGLPAEVTVDDSVLFNIPLLGTPGDLYRDRMRKKQDMFDEPTTRCFLGGDERLNGGTFRANDGAGQWLVRTSGTIPASIAGRADAAYLWPLSAVLNPSYRGVIFVEGHVAVSGVARGRVTVASRGNIVVAHNLTQAQNPGTTGCRPDGDIVGLFAGKSTFTADNLLITPQWRRNNTDNGDDWTWPRKDFDPDIRRPDFALHAVTLSIVSAGAERPIPPVGLPGDRYVHRGTMRMVGGQIRGRSGQTGTFSGAFLHGTGIDISFNTCALTYPPPFFPTTGRWSLAQYFEVNPLNFDPAVWFSLP